MRYQRRNGFTLVELLVVIAIIGILVSLLLPAVQAAREAARRTQCLNNLTQLVLAVQNFEMAHGVYPVGTQEDAGPIVNRPQGYHHGWLGQILPYAEQRNAYDHTDFEVGVYDLKNLPVRQLSLSLFACPSERQAGSRSSYAGIHNDQESPIDEDNNGVFVLNRKIGYEDITDGSSHTLFIGEKYAGLPGDLGWMSGTRAILRNTGTPLNAKWEGPGQRPWATSELLPGMPGYQHGSGGQPGYDDDLIDLDAGAAGGGVPQEDPRPAGPNELLVGGFSSSHPGGANFAIGDGSVRYISTNIAIEIYQQLGHRADGKLLSDAGW